MTKKKPTDHKTKRTKVKPAVYAEVDETLIPVIKWLNSFTGVTTKFSCQNLNNEGRTHIIFECLNMWNLCEINAYLPFVGDEKYGCTMLEVWTGSPKYPIRFALSFPSNKIQTFLQKLKEKQKKGIPTEELV